jgi:hypothetical protein
MDLLFAQQEAGVVISTSTLTTWMVGIFGTVLMGMIGVCFWLLRAMHSSATQKLDKIETCLEPVPLMGQQLSQVSLQVASHALQLPKIDTTLALMQAAQAQHTEKLQTHGKEIERLRDWRHNFSNELQRHVTIHDLQSASENPSR